MAVSFGSGSNGASDAGEDPADAGRLHAAPHRVNMLDADRIVLALKWTPTRAPDRRHRLRHPQRR